MFLSIVAITVTLQLNRFILLYYFVLKNGQQIQQEYVRTELTVCCTRFC